jgi:ABC-type bacteriocin/lantibiotic exporter with double-glycine peptidase domain
MKSSVQQKTVMYYLKIALQMLSKSDQRKILIVLVVNMTLSFLDFIGIALIGLLTAITVQGIGSQSQSIIVNNFLSIFNLDDLTFQTQVAILGISAAMLFIFKSMSAMYLTKRIYFLLSHKCATISSNISSLVFKQELNEIQKRSSQETLFAMSSGVTSLFMGILASCINVVTDISMLIVIITGVFIIDPLTSIIVLSFFSFIVFILYKKLEVRARILGEITRDLNITHSEKVLDVLATYRELLVHNRRGYYVEIIKKNRTELADVTAESTFQPYIGKYLIEITMILSGVIFASYQYSVNDALKATTVLGVFMAATFRVAPAILRIQQGFLGIKNNMGSSDSTIGMIKDLVAVDQEDDSFNIDFYDFNHIGFQPSITIENLEFKYSNDSNFILQYKAYNFKSHAITAITGPSGVGKSTLVDLILGINQPKQGIIKISGLSPRDAFKKWPGAVSYVPQNAAMIKGTIRENISIGFTEKFFSDETLWKVLERAQLKEFVETLPGKLEADLLEIGSNLSGGQRQRLGIARALVTNPKILILDEATSALDGGTENEIISTLQSLTDSVTVILVAHRFSTIRVADELVYIENGKKIISGSIDKIRTESDNFNRVFNLAETDEDMRQ